MQSKITKKFLTLVFAAIIISLPWSASAADFKTVAVVSIDALHPDALTAKYAPLTLALLKKGNLTGRGWSTMPPKTLIAHSAMLTGLPPQLGGMDINTWSKGEPTVPGQTLFHTMKERGYRTGFFYSKDKLGYLMNEAIDETALSLEDSIGPATHFVEGDGPRFVFLHVNGLDIVGPEHGWMSSEYLEELTYIDQYLEKFYRAIEQTGNYLLIITSDHGGYGKSHGGSHPDEALLPFGVVSDVCSFPEVTGMAIRIMELPSFVEQALECTPVAGGSGGQESN